MTKIILIRHGEAEGNKTGKLMGCRVGSFLTEKGKKEAEKVGVFLKDNYKITSFFFKSSTKSHRNSGNNK